MGEETQIFSQRLLLVIPEILVYFFFGETHEMNPGNRSAAQRADELHQQPALFSLIRN